MLWCLFCLQMQRLPNASVARVDRDKVVNYLLCTVHPDGQSKARFFMRFGFSLDAWEELVAALKKHGVNNDVVSVVKTQYGVRYVWMGLYYCPMGGIHKSGQFG